MRGHGRRRQRFAVALAAAGLVAAAACSSGDGDTPDDGAGSDEETTGTTAAETALPAGYEGYTSDVYADDAHWLCKPGIADDVCARDLDATAVAAGGSTEVVEHHAADDPPVDCFYVYPTTSQDPGPNSDFDAAEEQEIYTAYNQVARLTSTCRLYAPIYRQLTLSSIGGGAEPTDGTDPRAVAYGDVVDAFTHYVATESDGRGFVLIGHSQGAGMLTRLIADEIDDEPLLRDRLVSAYLLGSSVQVADGDVVGGDFADVPLCEQPDQTGCVVSYSSYRSTNPPVAGSFFGRGGEGTRAACVNPADTAVGGPAAVQPYFLVAQPQGTLLGGLSAAQPFTDPARTTEITTPWVTYPDLVEAQCVSEGDFTYLSLTVNGDPGDPRTDDIGGDLNEQWGMHLIDANVAMGDIEDLVATQAQAYTG